MKRTRPNYRRTSHAATVRFMRHWHARYGLRWDNRLLMRKKPRYISAFNQRLFHRPPFLPF